MAGHPFFISPVTHKDRRWMKEFLTKSWGDARVIVHGEVYQADLLSGFIARNDTGEIGLITYSLLGEECEIITLNSNLERQGVGTALLKAVALVAITAECQRLWLITTNDNLQALGFYQKRGFRLCGLHPEAVNRARELKPSIARIAENGIPIRDEIELEIHPLLLVE
jgi:ribosomal protein S18 acetylase RimI-like enzyme